MQLADRTERPLESWEGVYSRTRKVSKMKLGEDEREDEELEKVGQLVTVYEIYSGAGAWPFLHHGVLYRAVSLVSFMPLFCLPMSSGAISNRFCSHGTIIFQTSMCCEQLMSLFIHVVQLFLLCLTV